MKFKVETHYNGKIYFGLIKGIKGGYSQAKTMKELDVNMREVLTKTNKKLKNDKIELEYKII